MEQQVHKASEQKTRASGIPSRKGKDSGSGGARSPQKSLSTEDGDASVDTLDLPLTSAPSTPQFLKRRSLTPTRQQFSSRNAKDSMVKEPLYLSSLDEASWNAASTEAMSPLVTKPQEVFLQKTVAVRVRPFLGDELHIPRRIVSAPAHDRILIVNPNSFQANPDKIAAAAMLTNNMDWAKDFQFSSCLWSMDDGPNMCLPNGCEYAGQLEVYESVGQSIVEHALNGVSSACIAYGHTGTGKTYSMFNACSEEANEDAGAGYFNPEAGLVPRIISMIIIGLGARIGGESKVTITFLEIHNERVRDLLRVAEEDTPLRVREHPAVGTYVEGLTKVEVCSAAEALRVLSRGLERRVTGATKNNAQSSRSHAIVTVELTALEALNQAVAIQTPGTPVSRFKESEIVQHIDSIRVQLVDLAGSEKDFSSKETVDGGTPQSASKQSSAQKFRSDETNEMKLIRKSLSTLGYIIKALSKSTTSRGLPYRDSLLTWLLKDALSGGRCTTTMLATISPSHLCYEESLSTLKYSQRLCLIGASSTGVRWADDVVTAGGQIDGGIKQLRDDLGAASPGSEAARILYRQTLNDPQQRLAKAFGGDISHQTPSTKLALEDSRTAAPVTQDGGGTPGIDLKESYRALRGQVENDHYAFKWHIGL
jgi:hypothetical protein